MVQMLVAQQHTGDRIPIQSPAADIFQYHLIFRLCLRGIHQHQLIPRFYHKDIGNIGIASAQYLIYIFTTSISLLLSHPGGYLTVCSLRSTIR